jgi:hypothetical protein
MTKNKVIRKRKQQKYFPFIGQKFNKVELIEIIYPSKEIKHTKYKYRCECGVEKYAPIARLYSGRVKSCGCLTAQRAVALGRANKLKEGNSTENSIISAYKYHCKKRGHIFELSKNECHNLFLGNCYYCNNPPNKKITHPGCVGEFVYNGIDRIDNNKGYNLDNCVSCCTNCNLAKRTLSLNEFMNMIKNIYEKHFKINK